MSCGRPLAVLNSSPVMVICPDAVRDGRASRRVQDHRARQAPRPWPDESGDRKGRRRGSPNTRPTRAPPRAVGPWLTKTRPPGVRRAHGTASPTRPSPLKMIAKAAQLTAMILIAAVDAQRGTRFGNTAMGRGNANGRVTPAETGR